MSVSVYLKDREDCVEVAGADKVQVGGMAGAAAMGEMRTLERLRGNDLLAQFMLGQVVGYIVK